MCLVDVRSPGFPVFWLVRYLGVPIFGLCCLCVQNFGFAVFWLAGYLGVRIPGCTVPLASDSSAHLDLRLSVWMFPAGRMVLRFFLGSHGTLVAVSAPFIMPLRDSDIPMNVPFTLRNKQPLTQTPAGRRVSPGESRESSNNMPEDERGCAES